MLLKNSRRQAGTPVSFSPYKENLGAITIATAPVHLWPDLNTHCQFFFPARALDGVGTLFG